MYIHICIYHISYTEREICILIIIYTHKPHAGAGSPCWCSAPGETRNNNNNNNNSNHSSNNNNSSNSNNNVG